MNDGNSRRLRYSNISNCIFITYRQERIAQERELVRDLRAAVYCCKMGCLSGGFADWSGSITVFKYVQGVCNQTTMTNISNRFLDASQRRRSNVRLKRNFILESCVQLVQILHKVVAIDYNEKGWFKKYDRISSHKNVKQQHNNLNFLTPVSIILFGVWYFLLTRFICI